MPSCRARRWRSAGQWHACRPAAVREIVVPRLAQTRRLDEQGHNGDEEAAYGDERKQKWIAEGTVGPNRLHQTLPGAVAQKA